MRLPAAILAVALLGSLLPAQTTAPALYKVEFDVVEMNPAATRPNRHYVMQIDESRKGVFQAQSRIPYGTAGAYLDVGVSIECAVHESNGKVELSGTIDAASITGRVDIGGISQPIIGQRKFAFHTTVDPEINTVIAGDRTASIEAKVTKLH